ncbi:MAG: 6-bladed beta-propeller, partial [Bacteroidales bacterium]|nr:6-bladed beta-propeller [Bacteroidales bacterium]
MKTMKNYTFNFGAYILVFAWCTLSLTGCANPQQKLNTSSATPIYVDMNKAKLVLIWDEMDLVNYVPLETTDESLIREISKIYATPSHIIIFEEKYSNIFLFDQTGVFLRKIGRRGNGPGEYVNLTDIFFEEASGLIYAHDFGQNIMLVYNLEGEPIEKISTNVVFATFTKV